MNIKELAEQIDTLKASMPEDGFKCDIFYGICDGKLGFHIVYEDYPDYGIAYLGASYEEAELDIQKNWQD